MPAGAEILDSFVPHASLVLCFLQQSQSLGALISEMRHFAAHGKLWLLWRKGGSPARGDVTERLVRESALNLGLVDHKVCSVDAIWTAMLFAKKK